MAGSDAIADEVATSRLAVAAGRDAIVGANAPDTAFGRPSSGGTGHFPTLIERPTPPARRSTSPGKTTSTHGTELRA
jgi:hypothetical protein